MDPVESDFADFDGSTQSFGRTLLASKTLMGDCMTSRVTMWALIFYCG